MQRAIDETNRRRDKQEAFNRLHGIVPKSIQKAVHDTLGITTRADSHRDVLTGAALAERIAVLTEQMQQAARELEFEQAAKLRDEIKHLSGEDGAPKGELRPGMIGAHKRAHGRTRK